MVPDLRPSSPFSAGPALFLAPSPIAWQARHLLNEVLPAAASCASAPVAVANEVTTTSALKVDVFMWCSLFLPKERGGFLVAGSLRRDKPRNLDRFHHCRLVPERTDRLPEG